MRAYRVVVDLDTPEIATYANVLVVCSSLGVLHPIVLLRYHRLTCVARVARKMDIQALALLFAAKGARRSWLKAVEADIEWIGMSNLFSELRGAGVAGCLQLCKKSSKDVKTLFKALNEPDPIHAAVRDAHVLESAPVLEQPPSKGLACHEFGKTEKSARALNMHRLRSTARRIR